MNRRDVISLSAAILSSPFAASAAWSAPDARVADFVKSGKIRAGLAVAPIMATKDETTGELRGVAVDLARELAAQIGVNLEQVVYARPGAVMAGLKSNAWDVAFLGIAPGRATEADFTPAYLEVDLTYLVPANSTITSVPDADKPGVRIAVPRNDLVDILLSRMLKQATLVRADTVTEAFELVRTGQADVCAEPRPNLLQDQAHMPGSRVLADRFGVNRVGIVTPKGNPGRLSYFGEFVEKAKASGLVQHAIERAGLQGVQVAPAAKLTQ
jgi:polar amino acid transport system substrate-binding protein